MYVSTILFSYCINGGYTPFAGVCISDSWFNSWNWETWTIENSRQGKFFSKIQEQCEGMYYYSLVFFIAILISSSLNSLLFTFGERLCNDCKFWLEDTNMIFHFSPDFTIKSLLFCFIKLISNFLKIIGFSEHLFNCLVFSVPFFFLFCLFLSCINLFKYW